MGLFTRKPKPLEPTIHTSETVAVPAIETILPVPPDPIVQVVPAFVCAFCGAPANPANQFTNGDLYLRKLPYNYLCNNCWEKRTALVRHRTKADLDTIEVSAPPYRAYEEEHARMPGRPLEDRAVNLAQEA